MIKHHNFQYDGGSPNIPLFVGDRYQGQDMGRDFWFANNRAYQPLRDIAGGSPFILSGLHVSKGTGNTLNITAGTGVAEYNVTVPLSYASVPPSLTTEDVLVYVSAELQGNMAIPSAVLDDVAVNYVKLRFLESNGSTRQRQKKAGTYVYEITPSYEYVVNTVAPTQYDILLCSFISVAGAVPTVMTYSSRTNRWDDSFIGERISKYHSNGTSRLLFMDGASLLVNDYPDLFKKIGYIYGGSSANFNIPDVRGYFERFQDAGAGSDPDAGSRTDRGDGTTGDNVGTKQADAFNQHVHDHTEKLNRGDIVGGEFGWVNGQNDFGNLNLPSDGSPTAGSETRPKNIYARAYMRY